MRRAAKANLCGLRHRPSGLGHHKGSLLRKRSAVTGPGGRAPGRRRRTSTAGSALLPARQPQGPPCSKALCLWLGAIRPGCRSLEQAPTTSRANSPSEATTRAAVLGSTLPGEVCQPADTKAKANLRDRSRQPSGLGDHKDRQSRNTLPHGRVQRPASRRQRRTSAIPDTSSPSGATTRAAVLGSTLPVAGRTSQTPLPCEQAHKTLAKAAERRDPRAAVLGSALPTA